MIKRIQQLVPLIALLALCPALVFSQVATGTPPFSSITGGPDEIDLANLNIHWSFPIIDKAGRALSFRYALGFDNSVWDTNAGGIWSGAWQPVGYPHQTFGWTRQTDAISGYMTYDTTILSCGFMYDN